MHLQHAEVPLDEQDPRLDRFGAQREVGDPFDRQPGRHLDDQCMITFGGRVAPCPGRGSEIGGELPLQPADRQVDPQLRCWGRGSGHGAVWAHSETTKCLLSSPCGRGITCTEISSPTLDAVSAPASVAALTAPTSPLMMTATSPSPTSCRPTITTLAALTIASAAARAATYPFVSIMPRAFCAIELSLSVQ